MGLFTDVCATPARALTFPPTAATAMGVLYCRDRPSAMPGTVAGCANGCVVRKDARPKPTTASRLGSLSVRPSSSACACREAAGAYCHTLCVRTGRYCGQLTDAVTTR